MSALEVVDEQAVLDRLDMDPTCDWVQDGERHGASASWALVLMCCGFTACVCDEHRAAQDELFATSLPRLFCFGCMSRVRVGGFRWERVGGGAS